MRRHIVYPVVPVSWKLVNLKKARDIAEKVEICAQQYIGSKRAILKDKVL